MTRSITVTLPSLALACIAALAVIASQEAVKAQPGPSKAIISGPVGPSPYNVVRAWHNRSRVGVCLWRELRRVRRIADRIFVAQRGETRLPDPVPPEFAGFAGSIRSTCSTPSTGASGRTACTRSTATGRSKSVGPSGTNSAKVHQGRVRTASVSARTIPSAESGSINETFNTIYVFSNDGTQAPEDAWREKRVRHRRTHFGKPQDVAFLPDGRILDRGWARQPSRDHSDRDVNYISRVRRQGNGPGQFNGVHAVACRPGGRIFALDRSGGRINVFRTTD